MGGEFETIYQMLFLGLFVFMMFKGQALQFYSAKGKVAKALFYLKALRDKARRKTMEAFRKAGADEKKLGKELDRLIGHRLLEPTSLDPFGIVEKTEHILDVRDYRFKKEMKKLLPKASSVERKNLENMLECTYTIEFIYKFIRHFYLSAAKSKNFILLLQLNMILPELLSLTKSIASAFEAFRIGQPIGDGIGPMIAAKMMEGKKVRRMVKDTSVVITQIDGRKVYLVKAEGPGGNVGEPDKAVLRILEKESKVKAIITIDAGLKLEGERTGKIEEGIGVAIGGMGIEKFNIEKIATKRKIPILCLIVKESYKEAIGAMKKEIVDSIPKVLKRVKELIREEARKGETVIVVGIGNTIGVGQ